MKRTVLFLTLAFCGCSRGEKLDPKAQVEAHSILSGQSYASEVAGEDILVEEVARKARQGLPVDGLLEAAGARQKLTWDPDWLVFRVAAKTDFLRPGFSLSGTKRMRALGPLGQVAGDIQELAKVITSNAPDEVAYPVTEFYRGHRLGDFPLPLYFYTVAFYNRDLASERAFARSVYRPVNFWGGALSAQGFLRMRPYGSRKASPAQQTSLTVLQAGQPSDAAMLYLGWPTTHDQDNMNWSRADLEKGLAELEKRYPSSLWIKTRRLELSGAEAARKQLGHRWERTPARAPQEAGAWSDLPACTVGFEKDQMVFAPERGPNLSLQVTDLLLRHQYATLDALFAELRSKQDPRLELAYLGCLGTPDTRKSCLLALSGWSETPSRVAPVVACLPALISGKSPAAEWAETAWSRGNEDPLATACLVAARVGGGEAWEKQLGTVANSLKRDFAQDRSLETLLDLCPKLSKAELADQLKQQLGSDAAYCRIAGRGAWKDVDPERFAASLALLKGRPDYAPGWAVDLLFQLARQNRRPEAARLLELTRNQEYLSERHHPRVHRLLLNWAAGKANNPLGDPGLKIGESHSRYVPFPNFDPKRPDRRPSEPARGSTVEGEENREFGFDVHFDRPITQDHHWKLRVTHPPAVLPEGHHTQCERPLLVTPDDPQSLYVSSGLRWDESIVSGRWDLRLLDMDQGGKVIAERSFNVQR